MTEQQSQAQAEPKGALDRIADLEQAVDGLTKAMDTMARRLNAASQTFGFAAKDIVGLQAGVAGLAKTLSAAVNELKSKDLISDEGMMAHIRKIDDDNDRAKLQDLLSAGFLEESEEVASNSLVVVSQKLVTTDGKPALVLSSHTTMEMPAFDPNDDRFKDLLGKKRGEQYNLKTGSDNSFVVIRIEKVYNLKESGGTQVAQA